MTEKEISGILQLLAVLFIPVIVWFVYHQRKASALAGVLPIKAGFLLFDLDKSGELECAGVACYYDYHGWSHRALSSYLSLAIDCHSFGHFDIGRRFPFSWGSGNWLIKKMRVMSEISSGDSDFDEKFSVVSTTLQFATTLLRNAENRKRVEDINRIGFNSLHFDGKILKAVWSPFMTFYQKKPNSSFVEEAVRLMVTLSRQIVEVSKQLGTAGKPSEGVGEWTSGVRRQLGLLVLIILALLFFLLKYFF